MTSRKRFLKVDETLEYISSLENRFKRKGELIGFRSTDESKDCKRVISISTSLSIILMQYDLHHIALDVLKKSVENDSKLLLQSSLKSDFLWPGRLSISTNLSFLYLRLGSIEESLKFIHESQSYILTLKESGIQISEDIKLGTDMLTFMILWIARCPKLASAYLDSAAKSVNTIIKGSPTKLNKNDIQNIYGLIVCSLAALSIAMGGNIPKAISLCEKSQSEFCPSSKAYALISCTLSSLKSRPTFFPNSSISFSPALQDYSHYSFPLISDEALNLPLGGDEDWLVTKAYQNLLLDSAFFPLVSPNTPALQKEQLEFEQGKTKILEMIEEPTVKIERQSKSVPRQAFEKKPQRAIASVLKKRKPSTWKNQEFIEKIQKRVGGSRDMSAGKGLKKRSRDNFNLPPVDLQTASIYLARVSPKRAVEKRKENFRRRPDEGHFMIEFNPADAGQGDRTEVTLIPVAPSRKNRMF